MKRKCSYSIANDFLATDKKRTKGSQNTNKDTPGRSVITLTTANAL